MSSLPTFKVVLTGPAVAGKSQLLQRLVDNQFASHYTPTFGSDLRWAALPGAHLQIWDKGANKGFEPLTDIFFRGADAVVLVVDAGLYDVSQQIQHHVESLIVYTEAPIFVMLNKWDIAKSTDPSTYPVLPQNVFRVSAKEGTNVKESFQAVVDSLLRQPKSDKTQEKLSLSFEDLVLIHRRDAVKAQFDTLVRFTMKSIQNEIENLETKVHVKVPFGMLKSFRDIFETKLGYTYKHTDYLDGSDQVSLSWAEPNSEQ
jgi:small GTP-binding protein